MLGHAITTELQLLAARDRAEELGASFRPSRVPDSARDGGTGTRHEAELPARPEREPLGRPSAA
jgi:hypothetical protein